MSIKDALAVLSGLVLLYAFVPYLGAIVKGETSPRKATWLVWAVGDIIAFAGTAVAHKTNLLLLGASIGATTTFLLTLKFGKSGWLLEEKVCLALSGLAIVLWGYFGNSNVGIGLSLFALMIAAWPMYVSAWHNPEHEDKKGWIVFNLSSFIALFAVKHLTFAEAAPAIAFCLIDAPMLYLLFIRKPKWMRAAERDNAGVYM